jgi:2-polyprenyl-3-methyl-5-hydroxy-6-metoxy-1,4-benzoquinol methylase
MTTPLAETSKPTPERILNALNAYQETAALKAAIELDVFTAIAEGNDDPAALAKRVAAADRGVRVLCDFLTVQGFLRKNANRYVLTEESARFLDRRSPSSIASIAQFLGSERHRRNFDVLAEAVRKGGTADTRGDNTKPNDEFWVRFAQAMAPLSVPTAEFVATLLPADHSQPFKVLDIAAGHGMYGITIAKKNPRAQIVAVDWSEVLEVAKENAQKHGIAQRYSTRPGSAFETDLGIDYDYALLTNIFHHFDMATCEKLMRRIHAALKAEGRAVTVDSIPNEDRVSPATPARFALIMLATTEASDVYTFSEYEKMFQNSGFASTTLHSVPGMHNQVLVSQK